MDELVTSLLDSCLHSAHSAVQRKIQAAGCGRIKTELISMIAYMTKNISKQSLTKAAERIV